MSPQMRYGIFSRSQMATVGMWWAGGTRWAVSPIAARWFASASEANFAGLRELPDPAYAWSVEPIPIGDAA